MKKNIIIIAAILMSGFLIATLSHAKEKDAAENTLGIANTNSNNAIATDATIPTKAEKTTIEKSSNDKNQTITYTDPQKTIVVKSSDPIFYITLQANPGSTGYSWFLKDYDSAIIKPLGKSFHAAKTRLIGAGGYEKWEFMVRGSAFNVPQITSVTLIYARPWDLQGAQASNFKIAVVNK
jgi:inhibitor of cysteine peptidase